MQASKNVGLAGNPVSRPAYSLQVNLADGSASSFADPKMVRLLISLMDMQAVLGGAASHWGGPSAFTEIFSAIHGLAFEEGHRAGRPWHELYHLVNDAGHCENAIYAIKALYGFAGLSIESLKGFRSVKSCLTGHGEAHLFPEGVLVSNGPLGSGIGQAQGLAMADRLLKTSRVTIATISDGGCMEGEAREALAAIPGLAGKGLMNPFVMVISDNNTKLNGRIDEESFSMQPTFQSLEALGWKVVALEHGHDFPQVIVKVKSAIQLAKSNPLQPVALHVKTIKGFGVQKTMDAKSGGHGFPIKNPGDLRAFMQEIWGSDTEWPREIEDWLQEIEQTSLKTNASLGLKPMKVQVGVSKAMIKARSLGLPVFSISADLPGSTGVAGFRSEFPEHSFDVGVAESNMVSVAAGFSKLGFIPVVDTFAQFGVTKGALPLTMAALSQAPIFCVFSHAGFQDAADGASHQALSYLAQVSSIPEVDCYILSSATEAEELISQAFDHFQKVRLEGGIPRSQVFFLGREEFAPSIENAGEVSLGKAQIIRDHESSDLTIAAAGPMLFEALKATERLEAKGHKVTLINPSIVNRPDVETFSLALTRSQGRLLTVEDHQVIGGLGSMLIHQLTLAGCSLRAYSLGVNGSFGQSAYEANELYHKHQLDQEAIFNAAVKLIRS